jgi:dolichyl-phosphate-mannose--protein O-mannosyl transferase
VRTQKIRIAADIPGGTLNELALFEKGKTEPLKGIKIVDIVTCSSDKGKVDNLFDEQDTVGYRPSFMNGTFFDEIYHARTAYENLHSIEPFETTHPPLGKLFIAIGIALFGMNPFGWRIIGVVFGAVMIPVMYLFGKKVFSTRFYAFCTAFLMMFDFMHFTQTRIATIDVYGTFFIILMYYFMYDYFTSKSYLLGFKRSLKPLFLSGLCFGLGAASKWIALYGAVGLALLFFTAKYNEYRDYTVYADKKSKKPSWVKDFIPLYMNATVLCCVLFFAVIPAVIYLLSYIPFMLVPGPGHDIGDVLKYQVHMFSYHSKLQATHSFSSLWWSWPLMTKPVWYYSGSGLETGRASVIVAMGNPAIWWAGIAAVAAAVIISIKKKDRKMLVIFAAIFFQYAPWIFVTRLTFIYHFFSVIPFVIICIVYLMKYFLDKHSDNIYMIYVYLCLTMVLFAAFYPVLSGMEVGRHYIDSLKWLKTWVF